jgi:plastocyanin
MTSFRLKLKTGFLALSLMGSMFGACHSFAGPKSSTHTVLIKDMKFVPDHLDVAKGDTVIWKNEDIVPHTATDAGVFDSKAILANKSFKYKFKKAGEFSYICIFHPTTMKASISVK